MKKGSFAPGALVAVLLSVGGLSAVVFAFMSKASPYVTVNEAKLNSSDSQHLAGDILPGTVQTSYQTGTVEFELKDQEGSRCKVVYKGSPPANMGTATKVVAVGGMKNGVFQSNKLLLKCPSKYESSK